MVNDLGIPQRKTQIKVNLLGLKKKNQNKYKKAARRKKQLHSNKAQKLSLHLASHLDSNPQTHLSSE